MTTNCVSRRLEIVQQDVDETIWRGDVELPSSVPGPRRIVLLEAEVHQADRVDPDAAAANLQGQLLQFRGDDTPALVARGGLAPRVVFADALVLP